jgi:cold-inducible RNA-binding protein
MENIMGKKLYVGNLKPDTEDSHLQEWFAAFGTVVSANVVKDRMSGQGRGFGFVEMETAEQADAAQKDLDGQERDGQTLKVSEAKSKPPRRGGGGYGGGGGGGYGGQRREGGGGSGRY